MKTRIALLSLLALCLTLAAVPAMAQAVMTTVLSTDRSMPGLSTSASPLATHSISRPPLPEDFTFWAWVEPGDVVTSTEIQIGNHGYFSNNLFDGTVTLTQSNCFTNNFGFDVCAESGTFN